MKRAHCPLVFAAAHTAVWEKAGFAQGLGEARLESGGSGSAPCALRRLAGPSLCPSQVKTYRPPAGSKRRTRNSVLLEITQNMQLRPGPRNWWMRLLTENGVQTRDVGFISVTDSQQVFTNPEYSRGGPRGGARAGGPRRRPRLLAAGCLGSAFTLPQGDASFDTNGREVCYTEVLLLLYLTLQYI